MSSLGAFGRLAWGERFVQEGAGGYTMAQIGCMLGERLGQNLNWKAVKVGIVSNLGRQSTKFRYEMVLWSYVWSYSAFKSSSHIFGCIDRFWSYIGYMVESGELVILWSYEIEGRGKWEFGRTVGHMWYLYAYDHGFHCSVGGNSRKSSNKQVT